MAFGEWNKSSMYTMMTWYNPIRIHSTLNGKSPLEAFYEKVRILAA